MNAKKIIEQYLKEATQEGHDLSKYYASGGVLIDFRKQVFEGIDAIKTFYQQPMPPGFQLIVDEIIETSSMIAEARVTVSSDVFKSFQMIEKLELDAFGKIVKFEMLPL